MNGGMSMKLWKLIPILVLLMLPLTAISAQDDETPEMTYDNPDSPVDLLASYYNAINLQDYARAYAYWQNPTNSYENFVNGFADTLSVQLIVQPPTFIDAGAGNLYTGIPTVLIAEHTDGTEHTYSGCFVTHKANLRPPDIPEEDVWHLYDADITEVTDDSVSIPTLLREACNIP
jgi:hypothetical protein